MAKLPRASPWRDQELNLPTQGRRANPTKESTKMWRFFWTRPKILWPEYNSAGRRPEKQENTDGGLLLWVQLILLLLQETWGRMGEFTLMTKLLCLWWNFGESLLSSWLLSFLHRHLWLIKCFLQTMALESNPRNAPHLNRKAFLSAFSFPQYLETSSVGQFTWTANICSYRSSPTMTTHNPYSFLPFKSVNPAFPNLLGGKIHQNRDQRWRVEFVL